MDIDGYSYYSTILDVLDDISRSSFVAIDLELSGVPTKQPWIEKKGKQTLQERYSEIKAAAEKYVILQIGVTAAIQDENGRYVCKPYNFDISQLIESSGIDIERSISFSSSAASFLKSVYYDFSKPFANGVPYLSRMEEERAHSIYQMRQNRSAIGDMHIKDSDVETLAMVEVINSEIKRWQKTKADYLNIGVENFKTLDSTVSPPRELTRFQKRLIHQVVRSDWPQLVTVPKRHFVQIIRLDEQREARIAAEKKEEHDDIVAHHVGFRYVVDALLGRRPAINSNWCAGDEVDFDPAAHKLRLDEICSRLQQPVPVVGHNCFLDFVYLYHTFVGVLPDTAQEFAQELHSAWPLIIDTKYMATHNCGDVNPASSLEEITEQLKPADDAELLDYVHPAHDKYVDEDHFHEAGFDSLLTAQAALRLERKLRQDGAYLDDLADELGGVALSSQTTTDDNAKNEKTVLQTALSALGMNKENIIHDAAWTAAARQPPAKKTPATTDDVKPSSKRDEQFDLGNDFWKVYGNRLRVFGTQENVLRLDQAQT